MENVNKETMLHACLLDMANEIKRICDKHNLTYFLIGGSLLGCIRHGGIIPWDDDLDIGMPRENYERFLTVCENELSAPFILCTPHKEKNYGHSYAKLRIDGTHMYENGLPNDINNGIFLDIFPIDRFPDTASIQKKHAKKLNFLRTLLLVKTHYSLTFGNGLKKLVYKTTAALFSKKKILHMLERHQKKFNDKTTKFYANFNSAYRYGKELFPAQSLQGTLSERPFNMHNFKIPHNSETILTLLYGDYMTPPPPEMQVFKHAENFDFGRYIPKSLKK